MQAGAARVYAVEASAVVAHAQALFDANPALGSRITLVHGKAEELTLPEKADILISEPMGTLLVNERMLETYVYARRHFLKPDGGKMFPTLGRIHVAAFCDGALHAEQLSMAAFWANDSFYGISLRALHAPALAVRSLLGAACCSRNGVVQWCTRCSWNVCLHRAQAAMHLDICMLHMLALAALLGDGSSLACRRASLARSALEQHHAHQEQRGRAGLLQRGLALHTLVQHSR